MSRAAAVRPPGTSRRPPRAAPGRRATGTRPARRAPRRPGRAPRRRTARDRRRRSTPRPPGRRTRRRRRGWPGPQARCAACLDRAEPGEQRVRRLGVHHAQPEHGELARVRKPGAGQQQPARPAHQPPVGQRNGQRAELGQAPRPATSAQRRVQPAPPGGFPVQRGEQVGQLGERHPAHPEHRPRRMPARPVDQVGSTGARNSASPGGPPAEQHRVPGPYPLPAGPGVPARVAA